MRTVTSLLTNKAYGYPTRGARRRRKPTILACLHQTANAKATAMQERNYANRAGSWGPSATAYIDRDGRIVRAIDPAKYAAWSQGDVASPNRKIPTIAAAVASGVNMNEWVHESIECLSAGTEPYTDAQFESVAQLVAAASRARVGVRPSTAKRHLADLRARSGLTTEQLIYCGRAEGWLVVPGLVDGATIARPRRVSGAAGSSDGAPVLVVRTFIERAEGVRASNDAPQVPQAEAAHARIGRQVLDSQSTEG